MGYVYCKVNSLKEKKQLLDELRYNSPYNIHWPGGDLPNANSNLYRRMDPSFLLVFLGRTDDPNAFILLHDREDHYTHMEGDTLLSVEEFLKYARCEYDGIYKQ